MKGLKFWKGHLSASKRQKNNWFAPAEVCLLSIVDQINLGKRGIYPNVGYIKCSD